MELVFVHGWGFDARFWDALSPLLSDFKQQRVDMGFFGAPVAEQPSAEPRILIGHSLGFVHALKQRQDYSGWVAINSFPRFVGGLMKNGCVPGLMLREMRRRLEGNPDKTLQGFYQGIGAKPTQGTPDNQRLLQGLDELLQIDVTDILVSSDMPGLVLASRNDPLVPAGVSEELAHYAKRGGVQWHDTANHIAPQNDPSWCAGHIRGFLQS